jgi:hypothetical protein
MKTAAFLTTQLVPCSAEVLKWNYWDGEHLVPVHKGYKSAKVLYQGTNFSLCLFLTRLPVLMLAIPTLAFVVQHSRYRQLTYALQLVFLSKTEIAIQPINSHTCNVSVNYKFALPFPFSLLKGLLETMLPRWFVTVYNEDMPLRIRRQRVLDAGFKDYRGMSVHRGETDKMAASDYICNLPILPSPGSPLLNHPFYESEGGAWGMPQ